MPVFIHLWSLLLLLLGSGGGGGTVTVTVPITITITTTININITNITTTINININSLLWHRRLGCPLRQKGQHDDDVVAAGPPASRPARQASAARRARGGRAHNAWRRRRPACPWPTVTCTALTPTPGTRKSLPPFPQNTPHIGPANCRQN